MNKSEYFTEYLATEGYRPKTDSEGDISFKCEGHDHWLAFDESDPAYLRLVLTFKNDEDVARESFLEVANELNRQYKVGKATVSEKNVSFSFEAFYADGPAGAAFISRAMRMVMGMSDEFFERVRSEAKAAN